MGKLRSGILGHLSGKVAGVVGSRWKDTSTLREYVIPANPNTTPQQVQRSKMRVAVLFLKALCGQIFQPYVDKFIKTMSGFNYAISQNLAFCLTPITYASIKITWGQLWKAIPLTAVYAADTIQITWDGTSFGNNGAATDQVYAAVYYGGDLQWYFPVSEVARDDGTIAVVIGAALNVALMKVYLFAAKYSVTSPTLLEMVSNSSYIQATV